MYGITWCCCSVVESFVRQKWSLFFFQAEDGIRDLVRSRGLGDVYKRQVRTRVVEVDPDLDGGGAGDEVVFDLVVGGDAGAGWVAYHAEKVHSLYPGSVSYTHLTLPTSDLG